MIVYVYVKRICTMMCIYGAYQRICGAHLYHDVHVRSV